MHPIRARRPEQWLGLGLAAALALAPSSVARAQQDVDETERWVPAFSLFFDALGQKASGTLTTGMILGPPLPEGCDGDGSGQLCDSQDPKIRPDSVGSDTDVAPLVGFSLELMTPRLFDAALRPRLFAHVDLAAAFGPERNLSGEGAIGDFEAPPAVPANTDVFPDTVRGQGSRGKQQVRRLVVSAGGGAAFTFELFDRRFRLKPSAEYLREELDLIGGLHRAIKLVDTIDPNAADYAAQFQAGFRFLELGVEKTKILHGIGPGLELEVDTMYAGPFLLSVYGHGRAYYLLGDLDDTLVATNQFNETVTFTFDRSPWAWRSGVGLRFRFLPE